MNISLWRDKILWFESEMPSEVSGVKGFVTSWWGFGKWLNYEGSNFINGLIHWWIPISWHYWEVMKTRKWDLVGGGRWLEVCPWSPQIRPDSLLPSHPLMSCFLSHTPATMMLYLTTGWKQQTENSDTMSQNKSSLP
jgi:hypothetical protein